MSNKNLKEILIKAPEGMEIDMELFNSSKRIEFIKEKTEKIEYPTKWDIFHLDKGWFISSDSSIIRYDKCYRNNSFNNNILPTEELAEQMKTFTKLITMRERYREIELKNNPNLSPINWYNSSQKKYVIYFKKGALEFDDCFHTGYTFSFLTEEARNKFYNSFMGDLYYVKNIMR